MRRCVLSALWASICIFPLQALAATTLIVAFGDRSAVAIDVAAHTVTAQDRDARTSVTLQPALAAVLIKSGSSLYLLHGQGEQDNLAIIVISEPSKKRQGPGFCGAGREDYAVLIEKKKNVLALKDRYLLQSCLKSITVDATDPDDIRTGLVIDEKTFSIAFTHLEDPGKTTSIHVNNGKFLDR